MARPGLLPGRCARAEPSRGNALVSWITGLSLRVKLLGSFAIVIVLGALVAFAGWRGLQDNDARMAGIYNDQFAGEVLQAKLGEVYLEIEVTSAAVLTAPNAVERQALAEEAKGLGTEWIETWQK